MPLTILPETHEYVMRVTAAGGSLSNAVLDAADQLARALFENGLWHKMTEIGLFAGDSLNAALVKLKYRPGGMGSLVNNGFVAGDYTEAGANGGLLGNGSGKYLNTLAAPSHLGATGHASFYLREAFASGEWRAMISTQDAADAFGLRRGLLATQNTGLWGKTAAAPEAAAPMAGFYLANRPSASLVQLFRNGQLLGSDTTTVAVNCPAQPFYLFAHNNNGTAAEFLNRRAGFYSLGAALNHADAVLLHAVVQAFQTALNRQA